MTNNIQAIYPLTPMQEGILYHTIESAKSDIYFLQCSCQLTGLSSPDKWQAAWAHLATQHDILRTLFTWKNRPHPLQVVREHVELPWSTLDWRGLAQAEQDSQWQSLILKDRDLGFTLEKAPVMRLTLVQIDDQNFRFLLGFHHIALDGWSSRLLLNQALESYHALLKGLSPPRYETQSQYADFVDYLQAADVQSAKTFWRQYLSHVDSVPKLANDATHQAHIQQAPEKAVVSRTFDASVVRGLQAQARLHGLTLNTLMLGMWALVMASQQDGGDVVFGTTSAGRPIALPDADKVAGLFINTLPFCCQIHGQHTLVQWLTDLQTNQLACRDYEYLPLSEIQGCAPTGKGVALFHALLVMENFAPAASESNKGSRNELTLEQMQYDEFSHYPLAVLIEPGERLTISLVHQVPTISHSRAFDLLEQISHVLSQFSQSLESNVSAINLMPPSIAKRLNDWNQTHQDLSSELACYVAIEQHAAHRPDSIALTDLATPVSHRISYAQLNAKANRLAHYLLSKGVSHNSIVPVLLTRGADAIVSYLAVMKCGAAYVALDPEQPSERLAGILESVSPSLTCIISHGDFAATLRALSMYPAKSSPAQDSAVGPAPNAVLLDQNKHAIDNGSSSNPDIKISPDQPAYVIYTSGSTGKPKGVVVCHRALTNSTHARALYYGHQPTAFLHLSSLTTDSAIAGIYWTLCQGGNLVLAAKHAEQDCVALGKQIQANAITHLLCIPSLYQLLLEHVESRAFDTLQTVIVAGESCQPAVIEHHQKTLMNVELVNEYGPSECCVWATVAGLNQWQPDQDIPIGRPIANTQVHVLDHQMRPVLPGVTGELYLSGDNLADGYLNDAGKTATSFIVVNISDGSGKPVRLYKTGDRVKMLHTGELIFVGRADNQIKVRGHRIEPEDIEHAIASHPNVSEALVYLQPSPIDNNVLFAKLSELTQEDANALLSEVEKEGVGK